MTTLQERFEDRDWHELIGFPTDPKAFDEFLKHGSNIYNCRQPYTFDMLSLKVTALEDVTGSTFRIGLYNSDHHRWHYLGTITLSYYPACCGMKQVNYFQARAIEFLDWDWTVETWNTFMQTCFKDFGMQNKDTVSRIIMNLVEYRFGTDLDRDDQYQDIEPVESPKMQYPIVYEWAKRQKKYREWLMMNANSGNILHHCEIVL
jgi:hypothetical protein